MTSQQCSSREQTEPKRKSSLLGASQTFLQGVALNTGPCAWRRRSRLFIIPSAGDVRDAPVALLGGHAAAIRSAAVRTRRWPRGVAGWLAAWSSDLSSVTLPAWATARRSDVRSASTSGWRTLVPRPCSRSEARTFDAAQTTQPAAGRATAGDQRSGIAPCFTRVVESQRPDVLV